MILLIYGNRLIIWNNLQSLLNLLSELNADWCIKLNRNKSDHTTITLIYDVSDQTLQLKNIYSSSLTR